MARTPNSPLTDTGELRRERMWRESGRTRRADTSGARRGARERGVPAGSSGASNLVLAKSLLVSIHESSCESHWGPCPCLLAQAIRPLDALQAMEASCEWQAAATLSSASSFWAKTAKGRH